MRRPDQAGVDWRRWRFLSFAAAPPAELSARGAAVKFAIATLNRTAETSGNYLVMITPTLWAVDTIRLGWVSAFWDDLTRSERFYGVAGSETLRTFFKTRAGTEHPVLRHDEFVAGCWEPQRYATAMDLPRTKDEFLRRFLRADAARDGLFGVVSERLTVSKHPGQLARFPGQNLPDGSPGVVWMRILHAADAEVRLTPGRLDDSDHTEFFWRLPNGLDGFASYDRLGNLSLNGSTTLSRDRDGESVRVGVSCVNCHTTGPKPLEHADPADKLVLFNLRAAAWDRDRLAFAAREDQKHWSAALLGLVRSEPRDNERVHRWLAEQYHRDLEPADVTRELGRELPGLAGKVRRDQLGELVAAAAAGRVNQLYLAAARARLVP